MRAVSRILSWRARQQSRHPCVLCHGSVTPSALCAGCLNDLRYFRRDINQLCPLCSRYSFSGSVCGKCLKHPPVLNGLFASYVYQGIVRQMLYRCKHGAALYLSRPLSTLMTECAPPWADKVRFDAVVAMPLSRQRLLQRGYNQSLLLAGHIGKYYGIPLLPPSVIQRRHTPAQSTLNAEERRRNVRGIFSVNGDVKNCNLLLIDDVVTTGATISELSRTLCCAGAGGLWAWAVAHPE